MIPKGRDTVTDAALNINIAPAGDVVVLDMWGREQPDVMGTRAMKVEPRRWWLIGAGASLDAIKKTLGNNGALTPIGGGLMRATLTGPGWRSQLMISGAFDAEDVNFKPGDSAATIIHHTSIWIDVISAHEAHVYFAASNLMDIEHVWGLSGG